MRLFKSKKAQITIFIIIGIILLFSSALVFYIKNKVSGVEPTATIIEKSPPADLEGMKDYVESCIYLTAKEGIKKLGSSGGYITPSEFGITKGSEPTEGNGLELFPNSGYVVPYWHYLKSSNDCTGTCNFASEMPPLKGDNPRAIESQVSRYIEQNLKYCVNDFNVYREMGYSIDELDNISAKTTVTKDGVVLSVNWPIEAGIDKRTEFSDYYLNLDVKLREMYEFSNIFMKNQSERKFFEVNALNFISMYSDFYKDQLPPTAHYSFMEGENKKWSKEASKKLLTEVLSTWVKTTQVKNSLNYRRIYSSQPMIQQATDKMIIETFSDRELPFTAKFHYSSYWPMYFDITPSSGDLLLGTKFSGFGVLPLIGISINQYEFAYDVSYPVRVELFDPEAFNGEGFGLVYAVEANIRNNKPMNSTFNPILVDGGKVTFACDEGQKKSGNITVNARDARTGERILDADVTFALGKHGCQIGLTDINGSLIERYPKGIGRLIVSKKPGYSSDVRLYAVGDDKEDVVDALLYPVIKQNFTAKKYVVKKNCSENGVWSFDSNPQNFTKDELFTMIISRVDTELSNERLMDTVVYNGTSNESYSLKLGPGSYEVNMIYTKNINVTYPQKEYCYESDNCFTMDGFAMTPFTNFKLDHNTFNFEVKQEDLYANKSLEFYGITYDLDNDCKDQMSDISPSPSASEIAINKKALIMPKFV